MEMESQGSSINSAAAREVRHPRKETGWGQLSSQSSRPPTLCYAAPPDMKSSSLPGHARFLDSSNQSIDSGEDPLKLVVSNTFLHVVDAEVPTLRRSKSDTTIRYSFNPLHGMSANTEREFTTAMHSLGSVGHDQGHCKTCSFYRHHRCKFGSLCQYCHHTDHALQSRPGKKSRAREKARIEKLRQEREKIQALMEDRQALAEEEDGFYKFRL
jgi:hypothetical protein